MTGKNFNDIDGLLQNRFVPEPSKNLSERIVAASLNEKSQSLLNNFLGKFVEIMILPKPAMAFASIILIGLFVVSPMMQTDDKNTDMLTTQDYFASVMADDLIFDFFDEEILL